MRALRWLIGLVAAMVLLAAGPVLAHAELESSDPADGAVLSEPPEQISLTFGEELLAQGNAVTLTNVASGDRVALGALDRDGDTVSVAWPEDSPAGEYRAAFRVVSADGHPITGSITFRIEQGQASAGPGSGAVPDQASGGPDAGPGASAPAASAQPAAAAEEVDAGIMAWVLGIGIVVLLGAGAGIWYLRRSP